MWRTLTITKAFKSVVTIIQSQTSKLKLKTFLWCTAMLTVKGMSIITKKHLACVQLIRKYYAELWKRPTIDIQWENVYLCICKFLSVGTYTELEFCWIKITFAFGHSMSTTVTNTAVEDHLALLLNISYCYYRFLDYL